MTNYIKREPVVVEKLTCNHPKVNKIWEHGGMAAIPTNGEVHRIVMLLMVDGTKKEFKDDGNGEAIAEAEKYLKSIV